MALKLAHSRAARGSLDPLTALASGPFHFEPRLGINVMNKQKGFTLPELMMTVAIAAVFMAIAMPYIGDFIKNNRLRHRSSEFIDSLSLARSEAATRNTTVVVCQTKDPTDAAAVCDNGDWKTGWIVFVNVADEYPPTKDAADLILGTGAPIADPALTMKVTGDLASGFIAFRSNGRRLVDPAGILGLASPTMTICDDRLTTAGESNHGYQITINAVGRAAVQHGTVDKPVPNC